MSHHLRYNEAVVESNSPNGKITIDGLKINSPESVLIRERYNLTVLAMIGLALKLSRKKTKDPIAKIKIEEQLEKCLDWLGQATLVDIKTCKRMLKIK